MDVVGVVIVKSNRCYLLPIMNEFTRYSVVIPMLGKSVREVTEGLTMALTSVGGGAIQLIVDGGMEFLGQVMQTAMCMLPTV